VGLTRLGLSLEDKEVNLLVRYLQELIKWNRKVNLVARNTSLDDIVEKHFLDSLTLVPVLAARGPENGMLLDVGSGAGFPGLVIKTVCPDRPVTLLEPRQRRVSFLGHVIRVLGLRNVQVLPKRTDELVSMTYICPDIITGRAVADVGSFLDMVKELAQPGALVICMQGASGPEQWERVKDNPLYDPVSMEQVKLPFSGDRRAILLFRKR